MSVASLELDLIEAYEEVVRVVSVSARPGSARRDIAERVRDYSESLLAVLDRMQGAIQPEWRCYRALALQLLAVARRFGELSLKIEGDNTARTPWGMKVAAVSVDIIAAGASLPFVTSTIGNTAAHLLRRAPGGAPSSTLPLDEVTEYVDATVMAACELYCNSVKLYASLCAERAENRKRVEAAAYSSREFLPPPAAEDQLFVLRCAFEDDDAFARMWARRFGASCLSVSAADLVNALDGEVLAGPDRTRRCVVETLVNNCFDVHADGMVDAGAVGAICAATRKHVFPATLEILQHAAKGVQARDPITGASLDETMMDCMRCSRLEAELALERRKNAELRAELATRPKTALILSQLHAAHATIATLQQRLGLEVNRAPPDSARQNHAESDRLRKAILGVGLRQQQREQQQPW